MGRGSCANRQQQSLKRRGNAAAWLRLRGIFFPVLRFFFSWKDLRRSAAFAGTGLNILYSEDLRFRAMFRDTKHMWVIRQFVLRDSRLDLYFELDSGWGIDRNYHAIS